MRLEDFLKIIPHQKRKKIKDFDKWYEEELKERWKNFANSFNAVSKQI